MNAHHTAGPWEAVTKNSDGIPCPPIVFRNLVPIANCNTARPAQEFAANARLIAAAPTLLKALKDMLEVSEHRFEDVDEAARAAITLAINGKEK